LRSGVPWSASRGGAAGRIGPVEFEQFGAKWVAVRCPSEFEGLMRKLQRATDPLFRQARMTLDGEGEAP